MNTPINERNRFSTIYILAALHENGIESHIAIDPHQAAYHEVVIRQPQKLNMGKAFSLMSEKSIPALAHL